MGINKYVKILINLLSRITVIYVLPGFPPGMFEWRGGGPKKGGGSRGSPPGEIKSDCLILVLKMVCFT